jgi:aminoglycoside phosphotransferase (APT) family kinase protein
VSVEDIVRRGLGLDPTAEVSLREISDLANINYVYRAEVAGGRTLYIKVVPEQPKRLPVRLPRERVFSEAEGLRRFRALAGLDVVIPEVLFVDREAMALGMSDVGQGRQVLFEILPAGFPLLNDQAEALGGALGLVHRRTRYAESIRPPREEAIVRKIIFDGLLAPGARAIFPETWDALNAEMQAHRECLVHGDLWSKNLLVREDAPIAIVDFEGVCIGDPAFDLGTLVAVALIPALQWPALANDALSFTSRLLRSWAFTCGSEAWSNDVLPRVFRATATFLAARGFGPFAYAMNDAARARLRRLARSLATEPPSDNEAFQSRVLAEEA